MWFCVVVEDENGVSKGYGFVRFVDERERDLCLVEMDGAKGLGYKPLTVKPAQAPKSRSTLALALALAPVIYMYIISQSTSNSSF